MSSCCLLIMMYNLSSLGLQTPGGPYVFYLDLYRWKGCHKHLGSRSYLIIMINGLNYPYINSVADYLNLS